MKSITLNVNKKNRMYFACTNSGGYACKLKITPESENLALGEHDLIVEDLSIKTKYGTDLIYSLIGEAKETGVCTLTHFGFNRDLVDRCHNLGGKWDAEGKAWIFSKIVADAVEELDFTYNSDIIPVEIIAKKSIWGSKGPVCFAGYPIAVATGRDSGARLGDGVSKMTGEISSGGSMRNWGTDISEGSIFRLKLSRYLAVGNEKWEIKIL